MVSTKAPSGRPVDGSTSSTRAPGSGPAGATGVGGVFFTAPVSTRLARGVNGASGRPGGWSRAGSPERGSAAPPDGRPARRRRPRPRDRVTPPRDAALASRPWMDLATPQPPRPPTIPRSRPPWTPRRRTVTTVDGPMPPATAQAATRHGTRRAERRRGADPRRARRRLRRHRHEPALHDEGGLRRAARAGADRDQRARRPLARRLGADRSSSASSTSPSSCAPTTRARAASWPSSRSSSGRAWTARTPKLALVALGIFGAALFYGDGMITPAISVLSAVEGLEVAAPEPRRRSSCRSPSSCWWASSRSSASAPAPSAPCSARSCASGSPCWPCSA